MCSFLNFMINACSSMHHVVSSALLTVIGCHVLFLCSWNSNWCGQTHLASRYAKIASGIGHYTNWHHSLKITWPLWIHLIQIEIISPLHLYNINTFTKHTGCPSQRVSAVHNLLIHKSYTHSKCLFNFVSPSTDHNFFFSTYCLQRQRFFVFTIC